MNIRDWIIKTGIGVGIGVVAVLALKPSPQPTPTPEAANQVVVYYSGHLDSAFHPACQDATGNALPCTGTPQKAHLLWAINWYYAPGAGHGLKYYDWNKDHVLFNTAAHCGTGDIVEKWVGGIDQHKCACLLSGIDLACSQGVPKP